MRDSQGNRADENDARVDPADARVLIADMKELPVGTYAVDWRVTSVDGHVVADAFDFTVTAADVSELPSDDEADSTPESSGQGANWMMIAGILGLGIVAVLGVVLRRKH